MRKERKDEEGKKKKKKKGVKRDPRGREEEEGGINQVSQYGPGFTIFFAYKTWRKEIYGLSRRFSCPPGRSSSTLCMICAYVCYSYIMCTMTRRRRECI